MQATPPDEEKLKEKAMSELPGNRTDPHLTFVDVLSASLCFALKTRALYVAEAGFKLCSRGWSLTDEPPASAS